VTDKIQNTAELDVTDLAKLGTEILRSPGLNPFPVVETAEQLALKIEKLIQGKTNTDADLALSLHAMSQNERYLNSVQFNRVEDWAAEKFTISKNRVRALVAMADAFFSVGLTQAHLAGPNAISFSKFRELIPAIAVGAITAKNIHQVLPYVTQNGPYAKTLSTIQDSVKRLVAKAKATGELEDKSMHTISFKVPNEQAEHLTTLIEAFRQSQNMTAGQALSSALILAAANEASGSIAQIGGTVALCNSLAALNPVTPLLYSKDKLDIGVPTIQKAYATVDMSSSTPFALVLATSIDEAAEHFGVATNRIREWDLQIAKSLLPKVTYVKALADAAQESSVSITLDVATIDSSAPTAPKKRGRPAGSTNKPKVETAPAAASATETGPDTLASTATATVSVVIPVADSAAPETPAPKKRGRPAGSTNKPKTEGQLPNGSLSNSPLPAADLTDPKPVAPSQTAADEVAPKKRGRPRKNPTTELVSTVVPVTTLQSTSAAQPTPPEAPSFSDDNLWEFDEADVGTAIKYRSLSGKEKIGVIRNVDEIQSTLTIEVDDSTTETVPWNNTIIIVPNHEVPVPTPAPVTESAESLQATISLLTKPLSVEAKTRLKQHYTDLRVKMNLGPATPPAQLVPALKLLLKAVEAEVSAAAVR